MRRFERIYDVVEPVEEYRHGGYHPVHLHDVFHQRYKIIGKLAYGQYSTVWLAQDQKVGHGLVALKILKADASKNNKELSMLSKLSASDLDHPRKAHVIELLNHFHHTGPNETHLCLVLPVMISDVQEMTISGAPHESGYVRTISRQILQGLDFLHQSDIVHCDLQPANIMISVARATINEKILQAPEFSPVEWLDGVAQDESAPKYLMPTQRRRGNLDNIHFSTVVVMIGDLGGAQWGQQCDQQPVTPIALRAPELIHRDAWGCSIDIWTLGCLIFELATNEPLFPLDAFGLTREEIDKEHHSLISQILCLSGQRNQDFTGYLKDRLPNNFGAENVRNLASFLLLMLQTSPQRRPSAKSLLHTPFVLGESHS
ncbi:hypothetical protein BDV06DRAFT_7650 [Aspergillus oleicola]